MHHLVIAVLVLCASSSLAQVDYCALEDALCGTSGTHVACTANTGFAAACVNATQIPFDSALRQTILQQHNSQRMQVATGNLPGFPSASNMLEMTWDDDLAYVAGFNARTCVLKHDTCRNTPAYRQSGQNLGLMSDYSDFLDPTSMIVDTTTRWFEEYKLCPLDVISKFRSTTEVVGHFTSLVQQKSGRIGCALVQYIVDPWHRTLLACNYSYTNILGGPVYTAGTPCANCASKCSTNYPGLCVNP